MPLVLASNEVNASAQYAWKDVTGVQYHYPNGYINTIQTGEAFIYYRGIRRQSGTRGPAEYFGFGTIGEIWRDPETPASASKMNQNWYCAIEEYEPFQIPVAAKRSDGTFFEQIPANRWRNGVRSIPLETFNAILTAAGVSVEHSDGTASLSMEENAELRITEVETSLMMPSRLRVNQNSPAEENALGPAGRYSRHAKLIGDRAEDAAMKFLLTQMEGAREIRHISKLGLTPGWDLEYVDEEGHLNAVEVKGAAGSAFPSFDITKNELEAAKRIGSRFWIYLVADCLGKYPKLYRIRNPAALLESGALSAQSVTWRITAAEIDGKLP